MKRLLTALAVCLALTASAAAFQAAQTPAPQDKKLPEVTLTGCLVQGSAPTIFVFQSAKKDPQNQADKGASYLIVTSTPDLNLRAHLNHEVTITGEPDGKMAPPAGQKVDEKDLPKITAKNVKMVSNTCALAQ